MKLNKEILRLAIPSILANITIPLVGMVAVAIAGHLEGNAAVLIGGITIGSMLFDLLYWNFFFLRIGTGGLTAQALGREDFRECANIFSRAIGIAIIIAICILAIQWVFVDFAFTFIQCSPEVRQIASQYFFIRVWAAPATLSLMSFKGWFIGMQDSVSSMINDLVVNVINIVVSIAISMGFKLGSFHFEGIGVIGVAVGTVVAQYSGLLVAFVILGIKYRKLVFKDYKWRDFSASFKGGEKRKFFTLNTNLFVRSACFIGIYMGFTTLAARHGDVLLASSSILMKIMLLFSYITDGFAYAGEALAGKFIGAQNKSLFRKTVRYTFIWSMAIAAIFIVVYAVAGVPILELLTTDKLVIDASSLYLGWLLLMPIVGCAAFTWDGIYIGATASKDMRNAMLWATLLFFAIYFVGVEVLKYLDVSQVIQNGLPDRFSILAIHILMGAYFMHLLIRTLYLSFGYKNLLKRSFT